VYDGDYEFFRQRLAMAAAPVVEPREKPGKQAYLAFKEESKRRSRHRKRIESTRDSIAAREQELAQLEDRLHNDIPAHDWEALQDANRRRHELENIILQLYVDLDTLESDSDD